MKHDQYPIEYRQMFQKAHDAPVTMTFTVRSKAIAFRSELYKYRYAVRDSLPSTRALYNTVMKIELSVVGRVLILQIKKSKFVEKLNEH